MLSASRAPGLCSSAYSRLAAKEYRAALTPRHPVMLAAAVILLLLVALVATEPDLRENFLPDRD